MSLVYLGGNLNTVLISHTAISILVCPKTYYLLDGATTQYLYILNYLAQQANADTGVCHGKMKCQDVKTAEPKPYCANPA